MPGTFCFDFLWSAVLRKRSNVLTSPYLKITNELDIKWSPPISGVRFATNVNIDSLSINFDTSFQYLHHEFPSGQSHLPHKKTSSLTNSLDILANLTYELRPSLPPSANNIIHIASMLYYSLHKCVQQSSRVEQLMMPGDRYQHRFELKLISFRDREFLALDSILLPYVCVQCFVLADVQRWLGNLTGTCVRGYMRCLPLGLRLEPRYVRYFLRGTYAQYRHERVRTALPSVFTGTADSISQL